MLPPSALFLPSTQCQVAQVTTQELERGPEQEAREGPIGKLPRTLAVVWLQALGRGWVL